MLAPVDMTIAHQLQRIAQGPFPGVSETRQEDTSTVLEHSLVPPNIEVVPHHDQRLSG